jgi:tRNA modification GTPase
MRAFTDTICAISTPPGQGAIAIIRISGPIAISIADSIFEFPLEDRMLATEKANTIHFGRIKSKNEYIDEVVVSLFKAPHSYTGEDIIEISCHGSTYIQQRILEVLVANGARIAEPGEFTLKAFMNGKLDLSQAEGVADLIASSTEASHRLAFNQMRGGFSAEINKLRNELLNFVTFIELELDFSEEDVEFADRKKLSELVQQINTALEKLIKSFEYGNVIKNGVPVAIIGLTNSGKSTLLNILLHDDKAIVSEIEGTTRDYIEDSIILEGIKFRFIDTAGIRQTSNVIETEGIRRTFKKFNEASIVICLIDIGEEPLTVNQSFKFLRDSENDKKDLIIILNKIDKYTNELVEERTNLYKENWSDIAHILGISAIENINIDELEKLILSFAKQRSASDSDILVTNARHFEALTHSSISLQRVNEGINNKIPGDLLAQDIREVLHYLGEITGEITNDEILGNIFKNFCIGK